MAEPKPDIISSVHLKGGCGKTTVLADLAIHLAFKGKKVVVIDTDRQGSISRTLTGISPEHFLPENRFMYSRKIISGQGLSPANTKYTETNQNLTVAHYPMEMFTTDEYSREEAHAEAVARLKNTAQNADLILIDTPPARMVGSEVGLFAALAPQIGRYHFLVPSRPNKKEIDDGFFCYESLKQLLTAKGVEQTRLSPILVTNLANVLGMDFMGETIKIGDSKFPRTFSYEDGIELPSVPRSGSDLDHYSIFMDQDIDLKELLQAASRPSGIGADYFIDHMHAPVESLFRDMRKDRVQQPQLAYLSGIQAISRLVNSAD